MTAQRRDLFINPTPIYYRRLQGRPLRWFASGPDYVFTYKPLLQNLLNILTDLSGIANTGALSLRLPSHHQKLLAQVHLKRYHR